MSRDSVSKITIHVADLPKVRLLIIELDALVRDMEPGPERDRLVRALQRFGA